MYALLALVDNAGLGVVVLQLQSIRGSYLFLDGANPRQGPIALLNALVDMVFYRLAFYVQHIALEVGTCWDQRTLRISPIPFIPISVLISYVSTQYNFLESPGAQLCC